MVGDGAIGGDIDRRSSTAGGRRQQQQGCFEQSRMGIIRMAVMWYFAMKFFSPKKPPSDPSQLINNLFQKVDIISAIEFDKSRDHLATGDRGGHVVLFERTDVRDHGSRMELERPDYPVTRHPKFRYKTEFQSYEPEFDYLKSLEIEEKINKIQWCQTANDALFLLSTNEKTIKY